MLAGNAWFVKTAWANAHKKDVEAIVKSWNEAVAYYRANPDESIAIMAKGVGGWLKDPKEFKSTLPGIKFYGGDDNKAFFGTSAKPGPLANTVKVAGSTKTVPFVGYVICTIGGRLIVNTTAVTAAWPQAPA